MYSWLHPIVSILQPLLTFFFEITKDWGFAVIMLTLFVRSALFILNLRAARQQVKQAKLAPQLQEIREQHRSDPKKLSEATLRFYSQNGIKPFATILISILQMPVFMGMYGLFMLHGGSMTSLLVPWVASLAHSDSMHMIPFLAGALTFLSSMIPLTSEVALTVSKQQKLGFSLAATFVFIIVMWRSPIALGLYWTTNSLYALMERGFYRTKIGRKLLNS
jgi:YidC/Oxa1 family membrane protein insertase